MPAEEANHHARQLYDVIRVLAVNNNMQFQEMADMFGGFQEGQEGSSAGLSQPSIETTAGQRFAVEAAAWAESVDAIVTSKKLPSQNILMLEQTPAILRLLGASFNKKVYAEPHMFNRVLGIYKDSKTQKITDDMVKKIPEALIDPIAIFRGDKSGRRVFMLEITNDNGSTTIVPVRLDAKRGSESKGHIVLTFFALDNSGTPRNSWFNAQIDNKKLVYANLEKIKHWAPAAGANSLGKAYNALSSKTKANAQAEAQVFIAKAHAEASAGNILTEADLVKLKEQLEKKYNASYYQSKTETPTSPRGERGAIRFEDGKYFIELFKHADASTVIHEVGHFAYLIRQRLATEGKLSLHDQKKNVYRDSVGVRKKED